MALVSQVEQSAAVSGATDAPLTGGDGAAGTVTKGLALLTRYFPTELVAAYVAITSVLPDVKPTKATIAQFQTAGVAAADIPGCEYDFDGRIYWVIGFAILAPLVVILINLGRKEAASWKMVVRIDAPVAFVAFVLWAMALPKSPLESICGTGVGALQIAAAAVGAIVIPLAAQGLKVYFAKKWNVPPTPEPPTPEPEPAPVP